jgi:hypothetical protein
MRKVLAFVFLFCLVTTGMAAEISGKWRGVLTSGNESGEFEVAFSASSYPIYSYMNSSGLTREVELTQAGQTIEYVPQGGGVHRIVVEAIDTEPTRVVISLTESFERSSRGYLDQQQASTLVEYSLIPEGLHVRITTQSTAYLGNKDAIAGGFPNQSVAEGILQRAE